MSDPKRFSIKQGKTGNSAYGLIEEISDEVNDSLRSCFDFVLREFLKEKALERPIDRIDQKVADIELRSGLKIQIQLSVIECEYEKI